LKIKSIVWFNDKDAANVDDSPAGVITTGVELKDYNIINGFWKKIYTIVSGDATKRVTISLNAEATYAAQAFDSTDTSNHLVMGILQDMIEAADPRMIDQTGLEFWVTTTMYNQLKREYKSYSNIEASYMSNINGVPTLTFDGYPVRQINFWDRTIKADLNDGAAYYQPHRAIFSTKTNFLVGVDSKSSLTQSDVWYSKDTRKNNILMKYKVDAVIRENSMFVAAY